MALPKISELSSTMQLLVVLVVGAVLWGASEYMLLKPISDSNEKKTTEAAKLTAELAPLRDYERKQKVLIAENEQLTLKLATLRTIVPEEKEVDNFIRYINRAANNAGIDVRRFTAKPNIPQEYYVEVPFEIELDGPYKDVIGFYDRLGKMERIVNVTDMKIGSIQANKSVGNKPYAYSPNETIAIVCTIETFFSKEGQVAPAKAATPAPAPAAATPAKK